MSRRHDTLPQLLLFWLTIIGGGWFLFAAPLAEGSYAGHTAAYAAVDALAKTIGKERCQ